MVQVTLFWRVWFRLRFAFEDRLGFFYCSVIWRGCGVDRLYGRHCHFLCLFYLSGLTKFLPVGLDCGMDDALLCIPDC